MNTTETKIADMAIGQNVTIPTTHWGTWTGDIIAIRETGPHAPDDEIFIVIRDNDGTEQEVRTSRKYTGYVNTKGVVDMTDEDVAQALGTTIDDQRPSYPDYADIQALENLAWADTSAPDSYHEYGKAFHILATEYGEDTLMDYIEQYYTGKPW